MVKVHCLHSFLDCFLYLLNGNLIVARLSDLYSSFYPTLSTESSFNCNTLLANYSWDVRCTGKIGHILRQKEIYCALLGTEQNFTEVKPQLFSIYSQVQNKRWGGRLFLTSFLETPACFDPPPRLCINFSIFSREYKEAHKYIIDSWCFVSVSSSAIY